jgi:hypothetical protein
MCDLPTVIVGAMLGYVLGRVLWGGLRLLWGAVLILVWAAYLELIHPFVVWLTGWHPEWDRPHEWDEPSAKGPR